jgi:hypothetical protein
MTVAVELPTIQLRAIRRGRLPHMTRRRLLHGPEAVPTRSRALIEAPLSAATGGANTVGGESTRRCAVGRPALRPNEEPQQRDESGDQAGDDPRQTKANRGRCTTGDGDCSVNVFMVDHRCETGRLLAVNYAE